MNEWGISELQRLRGTWPELRYEPDGHWVLLPGYPLPTGWNQGVADLAFRIPPNMPTDQPYAFWVRGGLLTGESQVPGNYTYPSVTIPFAPDAQWGQFSWALEPWAPGSKPGSGTGMVHFVHSIRHRLEDIS